MRKKAHLPANIYLFKVCNRSSRKSCEICSKSTIKTPERRHWRRFGVFIVNFEHISHLFLLLLLLTLNNYMLARLFSHISVFLNVNFNYEENFEKTKNYQSWKFAWDLRFLIQSFFVKCLLLERTLGQLDTWLFLYFGTFLKKFSFFKMLNLKWFGN